ncbi:MAG: RIP metalloprotease RseP [Bdellovibrionaceae bacterium]|nr:RIP metalloprotease RseP [Pseudobdellovibrionaceae bacterium]
MDQLISVLQSSVAYLVPMVVLLGLLIFVHELGHFLVAKYYKVRVEVFSLGFGPKIFTVKRGETTYAISAIPLGGYVKMFGDDPTTDVPEDQKAVSFTHKPVGQRIAVVLAGPLMNFGFAILIFALVALIGEQTLAPRLGDIEPQSEAYAAGFRSGDTIRQINGDTVDSWDGMMSIIEEKGDQTVRFTIDRSGEAQPLALEVTPKTVDNKNVLSWKKHVGSVEGLEFASRASIVGVMSPTTAAGQAGLKPGDIISAVDGVAVDKWRDFVTTLGAQAQDGTLKLALRRPNFELEGDVAAESPPLEIAITVPETLKSAPADQLARELGLEFPETYLAAFDKKSPAAQAGLRAGDKIVAIDGKAVTTFEEIAKIIRAYGTEASEEKESSRPIVVRAVREGQEQEFSVVPHFKERMNNMGREEARFEIGIKPMLIDAPPTMFKKSTSNPIAAAIRGWDQTMKWTNVTILSFVRLFQAEVSAKNIGGFISIGTMAKKSWQIGAAQFMNVMAIISINLFILNLLPVPVLDGGHLVFFGIEALRGAPLSMRKLEIAQQVGLILLLGLMVFALFNDIGRLFN